MNKFIIALIIVFFSVCSFASNPKVALTSKNTYVFRGTVTSKSVLDAQMGITSLVVARGKQAYPIYLVLDTPGGSIEAGETFIQFVKNIPNLHTVSIFAASMGSAIQQALPGKRLMTENGIIMFHRAAGGFEGQFEDGELESQLRLWKNIVRKMEKRNADRMSLSLEKYKAEVKDELWALADESVSRKFADQVVDLTCSYELIKQRNVTTIQIFIFQIEVEFSGCPLIRSGKVARGNMDAAVEAAKARKETAVVEYLKVL